MDFRLPGSSVHGISQARILECVAISFSRGSSQPRDQTWVSCTAGRFFTDCTISKPALQVIGGFSSLNADNRAAVLLNLQLVELGDEKPRTGRADCIVILQI